MMTEVIVIDDCISSEDQDFIENYLSDSNFSWYYSKSANWGYKNNAITSGKKSLESLPGVKDYHQFVHYIYGDNKVWSNPITAGFSIKLLSSIPYSIDKLLRIKCNLTFPPPKNDQHLTGVPHVDYVLGNFITAIYYVNDSDGKTVIYNETFEEKNFSNLTEHTVVQPKKGRLVVFDGQRLHAGSNPVNSNQRMVINLNIVPHKKLI
jgi:hypothetical protein